MALIGPSGITRHLCEECILDKPRKSIRGRLIFAVKEKDGTLHEVTSEDDVSVRHAYSIESGREGHYLQRYSVLDSRREK
jgi:hypothetical protein